MTEFLNYLIDLDARVLLFFNGMHTDFFDRLMMILTGKYVWIPTYAALLLVLYRTLGWKRGALYLFLLVGAIVAADQVCSEVLRPIFQRMRPSNPDNPLSASIQLVEGYRGGRYGFPSCHGSNSFCLAAFMAMVVKRRSFTWICVCWAVLHAYTRIYLGVHYPGDILCGGVIGAMLAWSFYRGAEVIDRRLSLVEGTSMDGRLRFPLPAFASMGMTMSVSISSRSLHLGIFLLTILISICYSL